MCFVWRDALLLRGNLHFYTDTETENYTDSDTDTNSNTDTDSNTNNDTGSGTDDTSYLWALFESGASYDAIISAVNSRATIDTIDTSDTAVEHTVTNRVRDTNGIRRLKTLARALLLAEDDAAGDEEDSECVAEDGVTSEDGVLGDGATDGRKPTDQNNPEHWIVPGFLGSKRKYGDETKTEEREEVEISGRRDMEPECKRMRESRGNTDVESDQESQDVPGDGEQTAVES